MFNLRKIIYLTVLSAFLSGIVNAEPGENAYQKGQQIIRSGGDPAENNQRAAKAFQKAVEAGHLRAHNDLAMMYLKGTGVSEDKTKARSLFKTAAEEGLSIAQYQYAEALRQGTGGDKDIATAIKWYERAADQGHVAAMTRLGALYADDGEQVEADYPRAFAWYAIAKQKGGYVSNGKLEMIERSMEPGGMDKAEKLAKELAPGSDQE